MTVKTGKLFIISAPTGGGKTSLAKSVIHVLHSKLPIKKVITYTTRTPRAEEETGRDYHFISADEFEKKRHAGFFLETTQYDGNAYGSPISIIERTLLGQSFVLVTDRPGAAHIKTIVPAAILIWICVPNFDIVSLRLQARGRETDEELKKRIDLAKVEIAAEENDRIFDHHVMNDNFDAAVQQLADIIWTTAHHDKKS